MKKKKSLIVVLSVLIVIATVFAVLLFNGTIDISSTEQTQVVEEETVVEVIEQEDPHKALWQDNKKINDDYIGEIVFESGIIDKSFVQATSVYDKNGNLYHFYNENGSLVSNPDGYTGNDVYIYTNWTDMSYDYNILGGSVFMDYRNNINDQNIIIYGHHFSNKKNDPDRVKAFTPLEKLLEAENYEDNKIVKIYLENEIRTYELVYVYKYDVYDEYDQTNLQYYRIAYNYDEFNDIVDNEYYEKYIKAMEESKLYDTGNSLTTSDKTLTLQTCVGGYNGELLQVCVFKLINTSTY